MPSLPLILDLLNPSVGSGSIFDILTNADTDGYFGSLSSYVEILSTVFTGIEDYVESLRGSISESDGDSLEQCASRLQELNGKIGKSPSQLSQRVCLFLPQPIQRLLIWIVHESRLHSRH